MKKRAYDIAGCNNNIKVYFNNELIKIKNVSDERLQSITIPILFNKSIGNKGLKRELKNIFKASDRAIKKGFTNIILSDRGVNASTIPIPSLLAVSGLHHHLTKAGTRTLTSIVIEIVNRTDGIIYPILH